MFGTTTAANILSKAFHDVDQKCRHDLANGYIVDERDYVSNFTSLARGIISSLGFKCHAQTLSGSLERKLGCDAIIVFRSSDSQLLNEYKIGLFECKWPRVIKSTNHQWDYHGNRKNQLSHFSDQIKRQHPYVNKAVIWEMFFLEVRPGTPTGNFDIDGSSCVRHLPAHSMMQSLGNKKWTNHDLDILFSTDCENIQHLIQDMIMCQVGEPLVDNGNGFVTLEENDKQDELNVFETRRVMIPVPEDNNFDPGFKERVNSFMKKSGLGSFLYIDLYMPEYEQEIKASDSIRESIAAQIANVEIQGEQTSY